MDLLKTSAIALAGLCLSPSALAQESGPAPTWPQFERSVKLKIDQDRTQGISYLIGGALTFAGGVVGSFQSSDPAEKVVYTVFQNVGIASVGYGYFRWKSGDESRRFYYTLRDSRIGLRDRQDLIARWESHRADSLRQERIMRAVVHGLLGATNVLNALRQDNRSVQNGLYFLGAINLLASVTYTFE